MTVHGTSGVPGPPVGVFDRLVDPIGGNVSGVLLEATSALRRARSFHPTGRGFHIQVIVDGDPRLSDTVFGHQGVLSGVARFSRSLGLPEPCAARKVIGAGQPPDSSGMGIIPERSSRPSTR